jgi:hypothetical protein
MHPMLTRWTSTLPKWSRDVSSSKGRPSARYLNPVGTIQGGWAATILDGAMAHCIHTTLRLGESYTSIEMKYQLHSAGIALQWARALRGQSDPSRQQDGNQRRTPLRQIQTAAGPWQRDWHDRSDFGVRIDTSDAVTWRTVGDVYGALLLALPDYVKARPTTWRRFCRALCQVSRHFLPHHPSRSWDLSRHPLRSPPETPAFACMTITRSSAAGAIAGVAVAEHGTA